MTPLSLSDFLRERERQNEINKSLTALNLNGVIIQIVLCIMVEGFSTILAFFF